MSIQLPQACHNQHASRGPAGPCCFRFVGRLFGGWMVCEIVQNRRKTTMIRPKAVKFFSGFENVSRGPAGPCCFRFVGRLFGGWIVCEIVQNRRKTSMIRPKAVKFFSGFRRDVWHRGWGKCVSKMGPLGRPGHAVSLFWGVVVKVAEVFHVYTASTSLPQPACFSWAGRAMLFPLCWPSVWGLDGVRNRTKS